MRSRAFVVCLAAALLLFACPRSREATPPRPAQPSRPEEMPTSGDDSAERTSLASLTAGACLIDRTGEDQLTVSALNAIDGNPDSGWVGPPQDLPQSLTVGLPVPTRVTSIGLRSSMKTPYRLRDVRVEAAKGDGPFATIATVALKDASDAQFFDVPAVEADRLRVTVLAGFAPDHAVQLASVLVRGQELERPALPHLAGSWRVNGHGAAFAQFGNHIAGALQLNKQPYFFEGGADGNRMLRLLWIRGLEYGYAAATVSRDGKHLSFMDWHEEPIPFFYDDAWFGERVSDALPPDESELFAASYLRRAGRWPLFGVAFHNDGSLDAEASDHALRLLARMILKTPGRLRLVSHEFREATPAANRAHAQRALDAVRNELARHSVPLGNVQFVTAGSDNPRQVVCTQTMRELYSSIDFEIQR